MKRRIFLTAAAMMTFPLAWASSRKTPTAPQREGPFYPVKDIPLSNNLVISKKAILGDVMSLEGKITNRAGDVISGARVEIWQCDAQGIYDHPRQPGYTRFDPAFTGFGATNTDSSGRYQFTTMLPYPYPGRPPHIHVKIWIGNEEKLTTQLYLAEQNPYVPKNLKLSPRKVGNDEWLADFDFVVV
ncbi:protocatechuate 3,4-dioxygenase [Veronia nyctiphanis]|uniref:Protocatechuate 3,4-dioxygenase n=1 Tax=Veronia nyctiphanis TaxID=1278244 RepID=A0A4Q0YW25_9GAMM|nr:protocatechuate 3,4-dioxygenase [Veronia nyctiphanis]RXJ74444.1 protocatechuate 3,4-dioxygenase [Veronia nyctiphanis]